jgi:alpha-D-ribose 1-methylphosphonate 5-triphosphate synthase subunit PhnH
MIVHRVIRTAKPGCSSELRKVLKSWVELSGATGRVYTTNANHDTVILDVDFDTEEDLKEFYNGLDWDQREMVEITTKINDLSTRFR